MHRTRLRGNIRNAWTADVVRQVSIEEANEIAGEAFSGAAATSSTLGAAIAAIPLARLAQRLGRRPALALGAATAAGGSILTVVATGLVFFPLLVVGFAMLGVGTAVGLQARFAATTAAAAR